MKRQKLNAILYPVFDVLLNGLNFISIVFISKWLTNDNFGIFSALMALMAILFIVGISIQTFIAKGVSTFTDTKLVSNKLGVVVLGNVVGLIMIIPLTILMRSTVMGIILVLILWNIHMMLSYNRGYMQGTQSFKTLNISFYIEVCIKVIAIIFVLPIFPYYEIALVCVLAGLFVSWIHSVFFMRRYLNEQIQTHEEPLKDVSNTKKLLNVIVGNGFLYYLTGINVIIVNKRVTEISGIYGLSSKFCNLIIAVILSIVTVLLPYSSKFVSNNKVFKKFVRHWLALLSGLSVIIWLGYVFILPFFYPLFFGEEYSQIRNIIPYQSVAYIFLGLSEVIVNLNIVLEEYYHVRVLGIACIIYTLMFVFIPPQIEFFVATEIGIQIAIFIICIIMFFGRRKDNGNQYVVSVMERH